MKGFTVLLIASIIAMSTAELPSSRNGKLRSRFLSRQEYAPSAPEGDAPYPAAQSGPYPPSGWRPSGQAFTLPARQEANPPTQDYGTPTQNYGAPSSAPAETEDVPLEPESETVNFDASQQTEQSSRLTKSKKSEKLQAVPNTQQAQQAPLVYVLPQAQLQNYVVAGAADPQGFQYFANLQAQAPISAPAYAYTSQYVQLF